MRTRLVKLAHDKLRVHYWVRHINRLVERGEIPPLWAWGIKYHYSPATSALWLDQPKQQEK